MPDDGLRELFLGRVSPEPNSGCWLWTGAVGSSGYGQGYLNGFGWVSAHRLAYALWRGPIPDGACVLHKCDVRTCVNPSHLFLGSRLDNARDKVAKGRQARGQHHWSARLTDDDVAEMFKKRSTGVTQRAIASELGVSQSHVARILSGQKWAHFGPVA